MNLKKEDGLSLVEMMVTVAALGLLMGVISHFYMSSQSAMIDTENRTDLAAISQVVGQNLRESLLQDYALLPDVSVISPNSITNVAQFYSCLSASVAASPSHAPIATVGTKPPILVDADAITGTTSIAADIGNCIFFIAAISPITLTGVTDNAALAPGTGATLYPVSATPMSDVHLGRFQLVCIYMTQDPSRKVINVSGSPAPSLRLVEWRSQPFLDYGDMQNLLTVGQTYGGIHLTNTCIALTKLGYQYALDASKVDATQAFHLIANSSSAPLGVVPVTLTSVPEQSWAYVDEFSNTQDPNPSPLAPRGRIVATTHRGGISGFPSTYSVAYNTQGANGVFNTGYMIHQILGGMQNGGLVVPLIGIPATNSLFPGGFEVAAYGLSTSQREIWVRTVFIASSGANRNGIQDQEYTGNENVVDVAFSNQNF